PKGRDATCEYVGELRASIRSRDRRADVPQVPEGTQLALARRLVLINDHGELTPTRLLECAQFRFIRNATVSACHDANAPKFYEVKLDGKELLAGTAGGLRGLTSKDSERNFVFLMGANKTDGTASPLASCRHCHSSEGIHSVLSFNRVIFRNET